MTTTQDRLTDALCAAARTVTAPGLRPLDQAPAPGHSRADPRARRHRWLAAVASAAAVALIAGLVVAASGRLRTAPQTTGPGLPRYYAEISLGGRLVIRATADGRVTAAVPAPGPEEWRCQGVTTANDRTFIAVFGTSREPGRIYRFRLTPAGRASRLTPVPGGNLGSNWVVAMALSPSGSQLAVGLRPSTLARRDPQRVVVLSTRTGARTTWAGGQPGPGLEPSSARISQLSWTANGRELVYLGYWTCSGHHGEVCAREGLFGYEEARTLNPAGPGGTLTSGRLLLRADGDLEAAAISPDGSVLTAVRQRQLHGRPRQRMQVIQFDARTGRPLRTLYRFGAFSDGFVSVLLPDPAGRYLIVVGSGEIDGPAAGTLNGWIGGGRLHRLVPAGSRVSSEAW